MLRTTRRLCLTFVALLLLCTSTLASYGSANRYLTEKNLRQLYDSWVKHAQGYPAVPADPSVLIGADHLTGYCQADIRRYDNATILPLEIRPLGPILLVVLAPYTVFLLVRRSRHQAHFILFFLFLAATFLVYVPIWRFLFMPSAGYEYVNDFVYANDMRLDGPANIIAAYMRPELRTTSPSASVLLANGAVAWIPWEDLDDRLQDLACSGDWVAEMSWPPPSGQEASSRRADGSQSPGLATQKSLTPEDVEQSLREVKGLRRIHKDAMELWAKCFEACLAGQPAEVTSRIAKTYPIDWPLAYRAWSDSLSSQCWEGYTGYGEIAVKNWPYRLALDEAEYAHYSAACVQRLRELPTKSGYAGDTWRQAAAYGEMLADLAKGQYADAKEKLRDVIDEKGGRRASDCMNRLVKDPEEFEAWLATAKAIVPMEYGNWFDVALVDLGWKVYEEAKNDGQEADALMFLGQLYCKTYALTGGKGDIACGRIVYKASVRLLAAIDIARMKPVNAVAAKTMEVIIRGKQRLAMAALADIERAAGNYKEFAP